jgi:predicted metal-dependent phosphoesterase TrpH
MKRIAALFLILVSSSVANAQYYYQDSKNSQMLRHAERHEPCRKEIILPQVNGYNVYKADLHIHTVFSDGQVLPKFRVNEAWQDGLDVVAVTDHIEYRPHEATFYDYLKGYADKEHMPGVKGLEKGKQVVDLNYSVSEALKEAKKYGLTIIPGSEITRNGTKVGHFNALFTTDNNTIYDKDPVQAVRNAKAQGALVMHNHPGWRKESLDYTETERIVYDEGLIDGVEVMNGTEFYPLIIDRVRERGLFIAANSDVHSSTANDYRLTGNLRPMTLILAKDKSLKSLREALEAKRTIALGYNTLCGEEKLLNDFFVASVKLTAIDEDSWMLTNMTSVPYVLKKGNGNNFRLDPFSSIKVSAPKKGNSISVTVQNMWTGVDSHPVVKVSKK